MTESPGRPPLEYRRVAGAIEALIENGYFPPGSKLPSEKELAGQLDVAYGTVRRAMVVLRERGLILTIWGKGTFVAPRQ